MGNQRGAILIVALVLLVLLGMMGTTSLRSVLFQEKVATALHDQSMTFEAAEAGLSWCESFYDQLTFAYRTGDESVDGVRIRDRILDSNDAASPVVAARDTQANWFMDETLWQGAQESTLDFSTGDLMSALAANPHCVRERVVDDVPANPSDKYFSQAYAGKDDAMAGRAGSADGSGGIYHFRTTAKGVGRGTADSEDRALTGVVLQSDYFMRLE